MADDGTKTVNVAIPTPGGLRPGRPRAFLSGEELLEAAQDYFAWAESNPIYEAKAFSSGLVLRLPHPRPLTIAGLCLHMGISQKTWENYRSGGLYEEEVELVDMAIREQKFAGAAVGMFNAAIIARDLGLADKKELSGGLTVEVVDSFDGDDTDTE